MKSRLLIIVLPFILINCACHKKRESVAMPEQYNSFVAHCAGRNIIQLPTAFTRSDTSTGSFQDAHALDADASFNVIVQSGNATKSKFSDHIKERNDFLESNTAFSTDILRKTQNLSDVATLFRVQVVGETYQDELHFMNGENIAIVKLQSRKNKYLEAEDQIIKFMSHFSLVDQDKAQGFCLGDLSINGNFTEESGGFSWSDNAGNRYAIKLDTFGSDNANSLLQRMNGPDSLLSLFDISHTVLRSGERIVAGMPAQEWLGWTNLGENGDEKTFKFILETTRPNGSKRTPSIKITFDSAQKLANGTDARTNMTNDEAMAVWDAVINSIRPAQ